MIFLLGTGLELFGDTTLRIIIITGTKLIRVGKVPTQYSVEVLKNIYYVGAYIVTTSLLTP